MKLVIIHTIVYQFITYKLDADLSLDKVLYNEIAVFSQPESGHKCAIGPAPPHVPITSNTIVIGCKE